MSFLDALLNLAAVVLGCAPAVAILLRRVLEEELMLVRELHGFPWNYCQTIRLSVFFNFLHDKGWDMDSRDLVLAGVKVLLIDDEPEGRELTQRF